VVYGVEQPATELVVRFGVAAIVDAVAFATFCDQLCLVQHLKVVTQRRLRYVKYVAQLRYAIGFRSERSQDLRAQVVTNRPGGLDDVRERVVAGWWVLSVAGGLDQSNDMISDVAVNAIRAGDTVQSNIKIF
jgi:hypothetical protein